MKITTVGGNGFIGGHVVRNLSSKSHEVSVIDVVENITSIDNVTYETCNVFDDANLSSIISELSPEILISFVGLADAGKCHANPRLGFDLNVRSVERIWDTARKSPSIKRCILISTASIYGKTLQLPVNEEMEARPVSIYGWQKLLAEKTALGYSSTYGPDTTIVRLFNVYGKGQAGIISHLIAASKERKEFSLYGSSQLRDFVYAGDVATAISEICETPKSSNNIFNIGTGVGITIKDIAEIVENITGNLKFNIMKDEPDILYDSVADISRIKHYTEWNPANPQTMMKQVIVDEMLG